MLDIVIVQDSGSSVARGLGGGTTCDGAQTEALCAQEVVDEQAKSEQVSGCFLLAMSGTSEWVEPLCLCCSQAHLFSGLSPLFLPPFASLLLTLLPMPCPGGWL